MKPNARVILLVGPTGSGKNQLAQLIHRSSPQGKKPFIPINCAAIPSTLLESELFGHVQGAFTGATRSKKGYFELAEGGILFLNEIDRTDKYFQGKLLGFFDDWAIWRIGSSQSTKLNIRVIVASSKDLWQMVESDKFLDSLYYRIAPITIAILPLCQRIEDIQPLAEHFARENSGGSMIEFSSDTLTYLHAYSWPGNVRELKNEITRVVLLNEGITIIRPEHLSERILRGVTITNAEESSIRLQKDQIAQALRATHGNKKRAAEILNMKRTTLHSKLKSYGITETNLSHK